MEFAAQDICMTQGAAEATRQMSIVLLNGLRRYLLKGLQF
jgi:hypothetical protein